MNKSLEEKARETNEKGRLLAETLDNVRFIRVGGYEHKVGESLSIVYSRDEAFTSDWETLKAVIAANLNGLRKGIEVNLRKDEPLCPAVGYKTEDKDITNLELLIKPDAERITDAYAREDIISKVTKKITEGIRDYLEKHPNALKNTTN